MSSCSRIVNDERSKNEKQINTQSAPAAIGPYSQGVIAGNLLFVSGQIPIDPATGNVVSESIESQTTQVFKNLLAIISEAGSTFDDVVKLTIYLTDLENFAAVNKIMESFLASHFQPEQPLKSQDCQRMLG